MRQRQWRNAPADADIDREEGAFAEVAVSDFSMQSDSDIYPGGLRGFPQLGCKCVSGSILQHLIRFFNSIMLIFYSNQKK